MDGTMSQAEAALLRNIQGFARREDEEVRGLVKELCECYEAGERFDLRPMRDRIRGLCRADNHALHGALAHLRL